MTQAICFSCGTEKFGAFTQCPVCKDVPSNIDQQVVSMALCEHMHSKVQLAVFAEDIRARRKLAFAPGVLDQAREALKDPQLVSMLGMVSSRTNSQPVKPAQSAPQKTPQREANKKIRIRSDAPSDTALDRTAFGILGATTRDDRRRIVELAEEKSLILDSDVCTKSRSDLTNPRIRLSVEIAWLPGISPKRASAYRVLLRQDIDLFMSSASDESPLIKSNLIAAAMDFFDPAMDADGWASWIFELAYEADQIDPEDVRRIINEDRAVAGFPEISGLDLVESEISERRRHFKEVIKDAIDRLPTAKMIDVITDVVESATDSGTEHAPILIDELIDSFEIGVRPFLDREAENVLKLVTTAHEAAPSGERVVKPVLDKLEIVVRNWDKVAQPIQVSMKARGMEHEQSSQLAYQMRSLGIDLFNKHGMLEQAQRVTNLLQEVFAELPEVANRLDEDAEAIDNIFNERAQENRKSAEWTNEITYQAEIGLVFKDTLRISPNGVEWKGNRISLDAVTGIGWGATRNSVNGVPTGTDYFILYCDSRNVTRIQTNRETIYSNFIDRLWKAIGVRLLTEMLEGLRDGKRYQFGDAVLDDYGLQLTKSHTFRADEQIRAKWSQLQIWNVNGSFYVGMTEDKEAYLELPYQATNNAHVLEAAIRMKFKNGKERLSSLLVSEQ